VSPSFASDPHSEQGHACPRNKFGIADYAELQAVEVQFGVKRAGELRDLGITGKFDPAHLRSIHRYLFQDVFPWAGEFRVVNISKGNSMFGPALHIVSALEEALANLNREAFLANFSATTFAMRAAFYLASASSSASLPSTRRTRSPGRASPAADD